MTEVILNDECAHCNDKECHNGEHFCRQAMKDNSFYKNAKLYKGFEVIQRPTYEELEKENAELKADNDARKFAMAMSEKVEKQLREENAKLKDEWQEQVQKATDEGYARTLQTIQLTKATEIIKKYLAIGVGGKITQNYLDVTKEAEQFLKEVEK